MRFPNFRSAVFSWVVAVALAASTTAADSGLKNLSTRGAVAAGADVLVTGFVVADGPKQILVRGVGPGLARFGVTGLLADPLLRLFDRDNVQIALNDDWSASDAAVFQQVGAFALTAGSKDAALVRTLPAGSYTAQVSGPGGATGIALIEVYDVDGTDGSSRLVNLSARARVGTGDAVTIPGLVIAEGAGTRRLLVRAAGPALNAFGVSGLLEDPSIRVVNTAGTLLAANDNWGSGDLASLTAVTGSVGAFAFPGEDSLDSALVVELAPGAYTVQVSGNGGTSGVALVEVYDATPVGVATVSIAVADAVADESGANTAGFTISRTGPVTQPLLVNYSTGGTALNGLDYVLLSGIATIPAGQSSTTVAVVPIPDIDNEPVETVSLTLNSGLGYLVGGTSSAVASITSVAPVLYLANLRPEATAASSTGYGTATILMSASGTIASVNVSLSNLSSNQTTAYLRLGQPGQAGAYILPLPIGQVSGALWQLSTTGAFSPADLLGALQSGLIYLGVESTAHPEGELRGHFILSAGSQTFTPPPAPPSAPTAPSTEAEAARFLTQATFGPTSAEITSMLTKGYAQWITEQMALTASLHRTATMADWAAFPTGGVANNTRPGSTHRQSAWWQIVLKNNDQLRQRVAFALSEILVISDQNATINNWQEGAANYYDLLVNGAFGNFRQLLEDVTLSPMMGIYLSHLRNAKADPVTGALPDENYAREIMQLFSIGLLRLQPDGTLELDASGLPIATYNQTTITEMAKVFTGWSFFNNNTSDNNFRRGAADYIRPMSLYPTQHDTGAKTIVGGVVLPANQGGVQDLKGALDALFNHPNTGPFIGRRLIQRLVTSNPSPAYVHRVAKVFENNGSGVRGDLGAVVRAILLDYEARSPSVAGNAGFGKLKEPLLRLTALLRAFNASDTNDARFNITNTAATISQMALRAPTVFNFFEPDYVQPGMLAEGGLYAPEFQILTDSTAITGPNLYYNHIFTSPSGVTLDLGEVIGLAATPEPLVDRLALLLAAGALSPDARARILAAQNALPGATSATERVRTAIYLVLNAPDAAAQR